MLTSQLTQTTTQPIQTTTQPIQTTNVVILPQNTTTTAILNTTIQPQNTTIILNIFNLTSQLMGTTTEATAGRSNQQSITSTGSTREGYFLHFGIIEANPFGGFGAFGRNNNNPPLENNNNNNPPLSGFEGGLEGFNLLPRRNLGGLDPNVAALVNALTEVNLRINYVERESNYVKPTEFDRTEAEDPNEWLE